MGFRNTPVAPADMESFPILRAGKTFISQLVTGYLGCWTITHVRVHTTRILLIQYVNPNQNQVANFSIGWNGPLPSRTVENQAKAALTAAKTNVPKPRSSSTAIDSLKNLPEKTIDAIMAIKKIKIIKARPGIQPHDVAAVRHFVVFFLGQCDPLSSLATGSGFFCLLKPTKRRHSWMAGLRWLSQRLRSTYYQGCSLPGRRPEKNWTP